jgi:hypothetical protein
VHLGIVPLLVSTTQCQSWSLSNHSLGSKFWFQDKRHKRKAMSSCKITNNSQNGMSHELTKKLNYLPQPTMQDITSKRHHRPMHVYQVCKNKVMIKVQQHPHVCYGVQFIFWILHNKTQAWTYWSQHK